MSFQHRQSESGQGFLEYALILFLISTITGGVLTVAGPQVGGVFSKIHSAIRDRVLMGKDALPALMPSPTVEESGTPSPPVSPSATPTLDRPREEQTPTPTVDGALDRNRTPAPSPSPTPTVDLVAYYALDEPVWKGAQNEVKDASESGFHGTARNGAVTAYDSPASPGNPGTCSYGVFDGKNDSVAVPHDEELELTEAVTVMAWVRRDAQKTAEIVTKGKASWRDGYTLSLDKWEGWSFTVQTEAGGVNVRAGSVPDTGWHHLAGVFGGDSLILYVDGAAVAQQSFSATRIKWHANSKTDLMISPAYKPLSGNIDEVRIYGRALDPGEIAQAMRATRPCNFASTCLDHNIKLKAGGNTSAADIADSGLLYVGDDTYEFSRDVELCAGKHIALRSGVTLDGKGYTLKGNDRSKGRGIFICGVSGTTVRNLTIEGFYRNYQIWSSSNNLLEDSILRNAIYAAIEIGPTAATSNVIRRNNIRDNANTSGWTGFGIAGSGAANQIYYNNFLNNRKDNISRGIASRNTLDDGSCAGNYFDDQSGSPDPSGFKLSNPWPADYDVDGNGVADCATSATQITAQWTSDNCRADKGTKLAGDGDLETPYKAITYEAWFKSAEDFSDGNAPLEQRVINKNTNYQLSLGPSGDKFVPDCRMYLDGAFNSAHGSYLSGKGYGDLVINDNEWHHLACTYDGTAIRLYKDGVLMLEKSGLSGTVQAGSRANNRAPVYIGSEGGKKKFVNGWIDQVLISNYAKSAADIASDASAKKRPAGCK